MTLPMADIGAVGDVRFVVPVNGRLRMVQCLLSGALGTANATLTVARNATNLSPTIVVAFSGSAEGDHDFALYDVPVVAGDMIKVTSDGGGDSTRPVTIAVTLSQ
jgi:hypothetical protein